MAEEKKKELEIEDLFGSEEKEKDSETEKESNEPVMVEFDDEEAFDEPETAVFDDEAAFDEPEVPASTEPTDEYAEQLQFDFGEDEAEPTEDDKSEEERIEKTMKLLKSRKVDNIKSKVYKGLAGTLAVAAILSVTLGINKCSKDPKVETPVEPNVVIGEVINDNFKEQTGVEKSSVVVKEGETLPWFVTVTENADGNSSYSVLLTGDYDQFINVEPTSENESLTLRTIMSLEVDKAAIESGKDAINEAIKNAKREDFKQICSYRVNEDYEKAYISYCSNLDEYKDADFDFTSARIIDLKNNETLNNGVYKLADGDSHYVVSKRNLIDANGKILSVGMSAEYSNLKEYKDLATAAGGVNDQYSAESFEGFGSLTETQKTAISQLDNIGEVILSGNYYEPVKEQNQEEQSKDQEIVEALNKSSNNQYYFYMSRNENTGNRSL